MPDPRDQNVPSALVDDAGSVSIVERLHLALFLRYDLLHKGVCPERLLAVLKRATDYTDYTDYGSFLLMSIPLQ